MKRVVSGGWARRLLLPALALALAGPAWAEEAPPADVAQPAPAATAAPVAAPPKGAPAVAVPVPAGAVPAEPAPASSPVPVQVDFRSALKAAADSSPDLEAARARVEGARWTTEQAWTANNPTLGLEAVYTRLNREVAASLGGRSFVVSPQDSYKATLVLRQALATFGRLHYGVLAGQMAERAAREEYRQVLADELANTADSYLAALLAEEEVLISQQRLTTREAALRDAKALFEAGTVARFDVLRVQSEATRARQQLIEARNLQKLAEARLASRMGLPSGTDLALAPVSFDNPPPAEMQSAMEQALARRPEIQALVWGLEAARARVGLAESQDNPTLGLQSQVYGQTSAGMSPGEQWVTGLALNFPLYDGGASRAQAGQAREAVHALAAGLDGARRAVRLDVENSFLNLVSRWERIGQARQGLEEATAAARVAQVRYAAGLSTSTELLDAQTSLVQAQQALAAARYGYLGAAVSWNRAVSGEYPVEVPGPLLPGDPEPQIAPSLHPPALSSGLKPAAAEAGP